MQVFGASVVLILALLCFCGVQRTQAPSPTTPDEFAYEGILLYKGVPECLGSLVSSFRFLTGCRCLVKDRSGPIKPQPELGDIKEFHVFAGFANRTDKTRPKGQYRRAETVQVHPKCQRTNSSMMYDYGLVEVSPPFDLMKQAVETRNLPEEKSSMTETINDQSENECFALDATIIYNEKGGVKLFELVKVDVTRQDKESCKKTITEKSLEFDENVQLCAKRTTDPAVECGKPDFAGLLFCKGGTVPIGMLTGRDKVYCGAELPEVYSRLDVGIDWFNEIPASSPVPSTVSTKKTPKTTVTNVTIYTDPSYEPNTPPIPYSSSPGPFIFYNNCKIPIIIIFALNMIVN